MPTNQNLLDVDVDGYPVTALIDTGAHISIMSAAFRRRLRKLLTPASACVVRVADGGTVPIVGMCTARVSIAGRHTPVLFTVLAHCPHDLILGLDFLSAHSALIDCSASTLRLELPILAEPPDVPQCRLRPTGFIRLPPKSVAYIELLSSPPVPDGEYLVTPLPDIPLQYDVAVPHSILTITDNCTRLPIFNFGLAKQILPQGICLANVDCLGEHQVAALSTDGSSELGGPPRQPRATIPT